MDYDNFLTNLNYNLTTSSIIELKNEQFSSGVASGEVKFLNVVEALKGVLTDSNVSTREKGIEFMSWLLSRLPDSLLVSKEINVLVNFYCGCLEGDHNLYPSALSGLLELVKMKQIMTEDVVKILTTLSAHVNCSTQLQPDRIKIYSILKFVIENYLHHLNDMGENLVLELVGFIDGESDPFCLIIIFNFMPIFLKNFQMTPVFVEEIFEVLSCYFPIDFNSATNEKLSITREDLSEGLQQCLSANSSISQLSIPLILEKAASTFKNAKIDSYKLLQECCKNLNPKDFEKHIEEFWKCLLKDILPGNEIQVCEAGLAALSDVIHLLFKNESDLQTYSAFMNDILLTIVSSTNRVNENMFQPAIRILVAVALRSKPATLKILQYFKTFSWLKPSDSVLENKIILSSLLPLLVVCRKHKVAESQATGFSELIEFYLNSAASSDYEVRKLAFTGLLEVVPDSSLEFRKRIYDIVRENIETKDDIRTSDAFVKIWRSLATNFETEFCNFLVQIFNSESCPSNCMWAISTVADFPKFTEFFMSAFSVIYNDRHDFVTSLDSLLNACRVSRSHGSTQFFSTLHLKGNMIEGFIQSDLKGQNLNTISEIIALLVRNQTSRDQQEVVDKVFRTFFESPNERGEHIQILEAVLGSVRPDVNIPNVGSFAKQLTSVAVNSTDGPARLSSSRLLAAIVNKSEQPLELLSEVFQDVNKCLDSDCEMTLKLNSCFLFTWIIKAVILRGDELFEDWISRWFALVGRKDIGQYVAESFRIIFEEDDLYLNLDSHCKVRILYRQRLFEKYPKLVKMYETADPAVKMNYFLLLVRLLQGVPTHLVRTEIANTVTIFLQCLDTEKPDILLSSLEILSSLLESQENVFCEYIQSFVTKFLKLARFESCMKIRIHALRCLYFYAFYPTVILLPIKNQVLRDLESCLDDKKRLTRKEAVRARCRWFLVGAPGEDILNA